MSEALTRSILKSKFPQTVSVILIASLLAGCPQPPGNLPRDPTIKVENERRCVGCGGLEVGLRGTGFTPNGKVDITLFNVPNRPAATDFTNQPLLPDLFADANGSFVFSVFQGCTSGDARDEQHPVDVFLQVTDEASRRFARHKFAAVTFVCEF